MDWKKSWFGVSSLSTAKRTDSINFFYSLSTSICLFKSSRQHIVSAQSPIIKFLMIDLYWVRALEEKVAYEFVLTSRVYLARLTWIAREMGSKWPISLIGSKNPPCINVNIGIGKVCTAIGWLTLVWKSDISNKIKSEFLQAVAMPVLLLSGTIWSLTKRQENYSVNYVY